MAAIAARPLAPRQRRAYEAARLVLLLQDGALLEAERAATSVVESDDQETLEETIVWLDQVARQATSDTIRRRCGSLVLRLLGRLSELAVAGQPRSWPEALVPIYRARALNYAGDPVAARALLRQILEERRIEDSAALTLLASAFAAVEDHEGALDAWDRLACRTQPSTPLWSRARIGIIEAHAASGRLDDARRILGATRLLHPAAESGLMQAEFQRLRRALEHP